LMAESGHVPAVASLLSVSGTLVECPLARAVRKHRETATLEQQQGQKGRIERTR
jgi:hypothetical protein